MITFKEVEAFYWTAALSSFNGAAVKLHITQSSLSKRVAELEETIGSPLFDRSTKRVHLTDSGKRLLPVARQMLDLMETFYTQVGATTRLSGECRFGISELGALTWLPDLVNEVRRLHPALKLQPYVDLAKGLEKRVARGELDFAVAPGPTENEALISEPIASVEFSWVATPGRISPRTLLTPQELLKHPVITMTDGSGLTRAFERWAAEQGMQAQRTVACNSLMGIIGLTIADVGISFLPHRFIDPWVERGSLVALKSIPPLPSLNYCIFHRADDQRNLVRELKQIVSQVAGGSGWTIPDPMR
jgi:DNA-binding transcriptional LysR family regulator